MILFRMKMMNLDIPSTFEAEVPVEEEWGKEEHGFEVEEKYSPNPPSANTDLRFIDTDEVSPPSQRRRPPFPRTRKLSNPNENSSVLNKNNVEFFHSLTNKTSQTAINLPKDSFESSHKNTMFDAVGDAPQTAINMAKGNFESSHENDIFNAVGGTDYDEPKQSLQTKTLSPTLDGTDKRESNITLVSDLNLDFTSKLTFGDTQDHSESNYDNFNHVSHNVPNSFNYNTSNYEPNERTHSVPIPVPKSISSHGQSVVSDNVDDTDIMLHSFIRHDPPSLSFTQSSTETLTSNNPQHFLSSNTLGPNQHLLNGLVSDNSPPGLTNYNGQDTNSPEQNLSFQSISPHGSIGKETLTGLPENVHQMSPQNNHFLFPFGMNVQNNQEASNNLQPMHLAANSNVLSPLVYPGVPPGYSLLQQSVRPIPPGLNQYGYSNTNTIVPPDLRTLVPQQYHPAVSMNAYDPYQQAHLTNSNISQKEQNGVLNQSQIPPSENQPPLVATQNPYQMLQQYQLQMLSALNQYQMNLMRENPVQKPVENKQPITEQQGIHQQSSKTRDELQQEYFQAMQYINHLQQQLANASQQSLAQDQQPLPYNFSPTSLPLPIPNNTFHPGMQMMPAPQLPVPAAQVPATTGQLSPTALANIHSSLINTETGLNKPILDLAVGRGRGRLQ